MSFKNGDANCTFRCWMIGGAVGFLGMLLLWLAGPAEFLGALFWGLLLAIVTGLVLSYLLCRGATDEDAVTSGKVATGPADFEPTPDLRREQSSAIAAMPAAAAAAPEASAARAAVTPEAEPAETHIPASEAETRDDETHLPASEADTVAPVTDHTADYAELAPVPEATPAEVPDLVAEAEAEAETPNGHAPSGMSTPTAADPTSDAPVPSDAPSAITAPVRQASDFDGADVSAFLEEGEKPESLSAPRQGGPDDLKRIKGVGPKLERLLHDLGFFHFDQIANWTPDEIAWVDDNLTGFRGRVSRDNWVSQARELADSDSGRAGGPDTTS